MTIFKSSRAVLAFATVMLGTVVLGAPVALATSPVHLPGKPIIRSQPRVRYMDDASALGRAEQSIPAAKARAKPPRAPHQYPVNDPFAYLLLG